VDFACRELERAPERDARVLVMRPSAVCTRDGYLRPLTSALILAETPDDWSQGIPLVYVQEVADYWLETYDMNRVADRLNAYPQFTTTLDGVEVHMLHARSSNPNAKPLIVTHGWPGSVVEFLKVIGPLTEPQEHGGNAEDAFHVALQDPEHCKGIHLNMVFAPSRPELMEDLTKLEQSALAGMQHYQDWDSGYSKQQEDRKHNVPFQVAKVRPSLFQRVGWHARSGWVVIQANTHALTSCVLSGLWVSSHALRSSDVGISPVTAEGWLHGC